MTYLFSAYELRHHRPGDLICNLLTDLNVPAADAAKRLDVPDDAFEEFLHRGGAVSPELALRLEAVFGATAEFWLHMQADYDATNIRSSEAQITRNLKPYDLDMLCRNSLSEGF